MMGSLRRPTAAVPALAAALLMGTTAGATAATATTTAPSAATAKKITTIFTKEYKAQLAYTTAKLGAAVAAAQQQLGSTASSIDSLSSSNSNAATALVDELEHQYDAAGAVGLLKPAVTAFASLAKLQLTKTEHQQAVADEAYVKRALAINTAADLSKWQAASYAPGSEPSNTKAYGGVVGLSLPSISLPISGSTKAVKAFVKLENEANSLTGNAFNTLSNDWSSWIANYGVAA